MKDRFDIDKLFGPYRGGLIGWFTRANDQCISTSRVETERCYSKTRKVALAEARIRRMLRRSGRVVAHSNRIGKTFYGTLLIDCCKHSLEQPKRTPK